MLRFAQHDNRPSHTLTGIPNRPWNPTPLFASELLE